MSILSLNVNGLNSSIKTHRIKNEVKRHGFIAHKKHNCLAKTNGGLEKSMEKILQATRPTKADKSYLNSYFIRKASD
jgi:hypothetical protein